jgi:hypothetical protein
MVSIWSDLFVVDARYAPLSSSDQSAWKLGACTECSGTQMAVIAYTKPESGNVQSSWLRCVNCKHPFVARGDVTIPGAKPLEVPMGVDGVERLAWNDVRECLSVGAYTAAVMMCRKLLLHIAVGHGLDPKNSSGRAPSFMDAVKHLEKEELITKRMRRWVDRIKDVGNEANHEISPVDYETAMDVAKFTEQLLRLVYEMDAIMDASSPGSE